MYIKVNQRKFGSTLTLITLHYLDLQIAEVQLDLYHNWELPRLQSAETDGQRNARPKAGAADDRKGRLETDKQIIARHVN